MRKTGAFTVYAGGIVFKQVFGIDSWMGIDFFWIGAIGLVIGLIKVGGWGELKMICDVDVNGYGDGMMSLMRSAKDPEFPWTGVILGSAIIGFWYWCTDQYIV